MITYELLSHLFKTHKNYKIDYHQRKLIFRHILLTIYQNEVDAIRIVGANKEVKKEEGEKNT